ncbi:MAG: AAA family ATPase, partial [Clostridia bacterium]|nr:AAA family ATPase [Clostridia bacterium]
MKLVKCYVSSFGKLKDFTYEFDAGLNTIKQDNGWGKSTLANFIKAMFYGISGNKRSVSENDRIKYRPWNSTEKFGGAVWFVWGDKEYKIERYFGLKESDDQVLLIDVATGKSYANTENLGKRIFEIDEEGFLSTTYFSQKDFEIKSNTTLTAKFNAVCEVQDSEAFDKALLKVEEKAKTYKYRGDKGVIPDCKREIFNVEEQMVRANNSLETLNRLKTETELLKNEVNDLQKQVKDLTDRVGKAGRAEACAINKRRYEKLVAQRAKLTEDKTSAEQILNGKSADETILASYKENLMELSKLDERISSIKADLNTLTNRNANEPTKNQPNLNIVLYVLLILGVVGGFVSLFVAGFDFVFGWIIVGVFAVLLAGKVGVDLSLKAKKNAPSPYLVMIENKRTDLVESEKKACELENKLNTFINSFNLGGGYDKATSLEYIGQIYRTYTRINSELKQVELEIAELAVHKDEFLTVDFEPESLEQLNLQLKAVQNEYTRKSIELANKQASMKAHQEIAYSYAELESKKAELGEKIKQYEEDF